MFSQSTVEMSKYIIATYYCYITSMPNGLNMKVFILGKTTLGYGAMDINIQGPGVAAQHCFIENKAGIITLHPCGNQCTVDGLPVTKPVRLSQGMSKMMCSHFECPAK